MTSPVSRIRRFPVVGLAILAAIALGYSSSGCRGGKGKEPGAGSAAPPASPAASAPVASAFIDERVPGEKKDEGDWLVRTLEGDCSTLNYVLYTTQYEAEILHYLY